MKREGRQHGMVRTYRILPCPYNPRPNARILNRIDSPLTAGLFTKVPMRPTNHSKFTGKCSRARCSDCHLPPACKSKDKTKGNNKSKLFDASGHRMVTWRVVDGRPGLSLSSISASGLLDHFADYGYDDDGCDAELGSNCIYNAYDVDGDLTSRGVMPAADDDENKGPNPDGRDGYNHDGGDMDFYDMGLVLDHIEVGDWCLVGDW